MSRILTGMIEEKVQSAEEALGEAELGLKILSDMGEHPHRERIDFDKARKKLDALKASIRKRIPA